MDVGLKGWDGLRQTETINKTKCPQLKELKTKKQMNEVDASSP